VLRASNLVESVSRWTEPSDCDVACGLGQLPVARTQYPEAVSVRLTASDAVVAAYRSFWETEVSE
jgi:hypothetical protein